MIQECFRHAKAVGAWGAGRAAVEAAGYSTEPGIVIGDDPSDVLKAMTILLESHRVWERFPATID